MSIAKEYGRALFLISEDEQASEKYLSELELFLSLIKENPEYVKILDTPAIPKDERLRAIDEALSTLSDPVVSVIKMLCERFSVYSFPSLVAEYKALYDERLGILRVKCVTAVAMSDEQKARLKTKLDRELSKNVVIENTVDEKILGGIILRYGDTQRDASLKSRLDAIAKGLDELII